MTSPTVLTPLDPRYPSRLRQIVRPPASLTVSGGPLDADCAVAVVGSREATADAAAFAREIAGALVHAGAVVVSGGAVGIDAAAHRGALAAGGRTWVIAATGPDGCYPAEHAELFETIGRGPGAMVWPFQHPAAFLARNRVLVALAHAVVVIQAGARSGALHAAECARRLGRPLWVVPSAPWSPDRDRFAGSCHLLEHGGRPLTRLDSFLAALGLGGGRPDADLPNYPPNSIESSLLQVMSNVPLHIDMLTVRAHQTPQATAAALLTLALENVVVEGPPGFFRRRHAPNH